MTFNFTIMNYTELDNKCHYTRCLSESAPTTFKEVSPSLLSSSVPCGRKKQSSYLNSTRTECNTMQNALRLLLL